MADAKDTGRSSPNVVVFPDQREVDTEAAEWVLLLEEDQLGSEDSAAFHRWLKTSTQHRDAFARLSALWGAYDAVKALEDYAAADDSIALIAEAEAQGRRRKAPKLPVLAAVAAVLLMAIGISVFQDEEASAPVPPFPDVYQTAIGEQKTIDLPDGSAVTLNTNTAIRVDYGAVARNVHLLGGEAYFDVTSDPARPFSVLAGARTITAIGTSFTVRLRERDIDVMVTKGRVAVFAKAPPTAGQGASPVPAPAVEPATEIAAGQEAVLQDHEGRVATIDREELARRLSWRDGVLAFSGDTLSEVVAEVSRYTAVTIVIDDQALADLPVVGFFRIGEIEEMFEALELMADLTAERVGPNEIRLVKANEG